MPKTKDASKPRGRMTAYAFFVQACRVELKKQYPDDTVNFSDFSRTCAERWKGISEVDKKCFIDLAEKDKLRYDAEMVDYVPADGRGKKRKLQTKDPNAPKRPLSAFFWFCNDERPKVKELNPEFNVGEMAKELGRMWGLADADTRARYEAMASRDKARYEREMTEYKGRGRAVPEPQQVAVTYTSYEVVEADDYVDED